MWESSTSRGISCLKGGSHINEGHWRNRPFLFPPSHYRRLLLVPFIFHFLPLDSFHQNPAIWIFPTPLRNCCNIIHHFYPATSGFWFSAGLPIFLVFRVAISHSLVTRFACRTSVQWRLTLQLSRSWTVQLSLHIPLLRFLPQQILIIPYTIRAV